ncbi:ATP-dependent DNA helicase RRM3 [Hypsizygus marmoreus]|uniref:ATP-dependent DNA helicase n=1 Tax=Hypsizygus marmoreus TaxID=39966 RepID=A0A369J7G6_HYPMA|nr:ATP-dependent DNA helicase RRM3 [Hypsizygus marmoreus]
MSDTNAAAETQSTRSYLSANTVANIEEACNGIIALSREQRRKKDRVIEAVINSERLTRDRIMANLRAIGSSRKRRRESEPNTPSKRWRHDTASAPHITPMDGAIDTSTFMRLPSRQTLDALTAAFIDRTGNDAMRLTSCCVCAREIEAKLAKACSINDIPSQHLLSPAYPHPQHELRNGMLLHLHSVDRKGDTQVCLECDRKLRSMTRPAYALANNMWIGDIPHELAVLTLPERLLIAKYFPAAYIVKLFPKKLGAENWDKKTMHSGLRGNVSTYRLDQAEIAAMVDGRNMPPPARILSALIGVTFVSPKQVKENTLPAFLMVRRRRIREALLWLKAHNPLYRDIVISEERLLELPENAVPMEIIVGTKYTDDMTTLAREHETYVPGYGEEEELLNISQASRNGDSNAETRNLGIEDDSHIMPDTIEYDVGVGPAGILPVIDGDEDIENEVIEPGVIPLQANGVIDVSGDDVPDNDIMAHAFSNAVDDELRAEKFKIRRGSAFINEYARIDKTTGQRYDGGPSDANHLLGTFPVLFPYGVGGFEVGRPENVPYESHARWALQYADRRFRKDLHFVFQVFGVIQKRRSRRDTSSTILELCSTSTTYAVDCCTGSYTWDGRITDLSALKNLGNDRHAKSSQLMGHLEIAQVMAGEEIDLDAFNAAIGPTATQRSTNIANDPYASARYFHTIVRIILEEVFGLKSNHTHNIDRKEGVFGMINSYIGTVEAQGRGSLHLHMLIWLKDSPTSSEMKAALQTEEFRQRIRAFVASNVRADLDGADTATVNAIEKVKDLPYSRPVDPREPNYEAKLKTRERTTARAVQLHKCEGGGRCLKPVGGRWVCKRRAPFPVAAEDWVNEEGEWGPKRTAAYLNNWNPMLLNLLRANHDIKLIMYSGQTKNLSWYITNYATKKQMPSFNISALLAKRLAFHYIQEKNTADILAMNKRLIQRCANTLSRNQELTAPEVISLLMGWGDRFESHFYTPIYWDNAVFALKAQFPELRSRRGLQPIAADSTAVDDERTEKPHEPAQRVVVEDGELRVKDQVKDYRYRGEALLDSNYLDFFLNTYEGRLDSHSDTSGETTTQRTISERVPYQLEAEKGTRCRIIRGAGHETLPNFIGQWFPRSDEPSLREFYCASMLFLLKPWNSLGDLKSGHPSFEAAFNQFMGQAPTRIHRIVDNIQFYYESSDSAKRRAEEEHQRTGGAVDVDEHLDIEPFSEATEDNMPSEITEQDIECARQQAESAREVHFGQVAVNTAIDVGIFHEDQPQTVYKQIAATAHRDDERQYQDWAKMLKAVTRNGPILEHDETLPTPTTTEANHQPMTIPAYVPIADTSAAVLPVQEPTTDISRRITRDRLAILNVDQRRAYQIVENQILARLRGESPPQLLLMIQGQGGTGKSLIINAITKTFEELGIRDKLAKTASSGVAASLIGGETLHSWAGIPVRTGDGDWTERGDARTQVKRLRNIKGKMMALVDECSMITKEHLCLVSQSAGKVLAGEYRNDSTLPFGAIDFILIGDFHQFPPVKNKSGALYCDRPLTDKTRALIGREIFLQFKKVVILKEQKRIQDATWARILTNLRDGDCDGSDIEEIRKLVLTNPECNVPDFDSPEWNEPILVTSRHGVRQQWNAAALERHCTTTGQRLYVVQAEDTLGKTGLPLQPKHRILVVGMSTKTTGNIAERVEIAVGMKAMVLLNIATEADVANGTRGKVVDVVLDSREAMATPGDDGKIHLRFPPAVILFKPDHRPSVRFPGLEDGVVPISPTEVTFRITTPDKVHHQIRRRQLAITPAYAFTDYKSQGQTIERVIVDIGKPPTGELTPFSAYVSLSRSRGRDTIRLLRDFDERLFTTHPSEDLRQEDIRLKILDRQTVIV